MIKTRRRWRTQGSTSTRDEDVGITYPKDQVSYCTVTNTVGYCSPYPKDQEVKMRDKGEVTGVYIL